MVLETSNSNSNSHEKGYSGSHEPSNSTSSLNSIGNICNYQEDCLSPSFWDYEGIPYDAISQIMNADEYDKSCVSVKLENDKKQRSLYSSSLMRDGLIDDENGNLLLYCGSVIYTKNNCYRVINFIDGGTFGQTYKCRHVDSGQLVAIKVVRSLPKFYEQGNNEYLALKWISEQPRNNTNFLIYLLDYTILHFHHVFVFPLYAFSLYHVIYLTSQGLSLHVIRNIAYETLQALTFLHQHGIIHTDVKPENIMFSRNSLDLRNNPIRLIDLGSCANDTPRPTALCQSLYYRAPEVTLCLGYDTSIDIWSLGCVLVELFLGRPLFKGNSDLEVLSLIESCVGPIPAELVIRSQMRSDFFVSDSNDIFHVKPLSSERESKIRPYRFYYEDMIRYRFQIDILEGKEQEPEASQFLQFLKFLLCPNPCNRHPAHCLLQHPFITGSSSPYSPIFAFHCSLYDAQNHYGCYVGVPLVSPTIPPMPVTITALPYGTMLCDPLRGTISIDSFYRSPGYCSRVYDKQNRNQKQMGGWSSDISQVSM
ncbi:hypothetical protein WA171_001660, partial [Blastocystis sp. BT1]